MPCSTTSAPAQELFEHLVASGLCLYEQRHWCGLTDAQKLGLRHLLMGKVPLAGYLRVAGQPGAVSGLQRALTRIYLFYRNVAAHDHIGLYKSIL